MLVAVTLSFMIFFPLVVATSMFKVLNEKQSSKFLRIFSKILPLRFCFKFSGRYSFYLL